MTMTTTVLITLVFIWAVAYGLGMRFKQTKADGTRRIPVWTKLVMIAVTLVVAGYGLVYGGGYARLCAAWWVVVGLVMGAVGDLILADLFRVKRTEIAAMGAFGLGHLCYIAAILAARAVYGLGGLGLLLAGVAGAALGVAGWRALVYNPGGSRVLNAGSLVYGLLLFVTVGLAVGLAAGSGELASLAVGLALFAVSDVILAQALIRKRGTPLLRDIVWIIYSGGQMLIAYSVGMFRC
jgi:uncharacterized membrane protein YhhN